MGKGSINKKCEYDDGSPINGAKVFLKKNATVNWTKFTNIWGWANFSDLDPYIYYIYTDMDNDGSWDGVPDVLYVGAGEVINITNDFPLSLKK